MESATAKALDFTVEVLTFEEVGLSCDLERQLPERPDDRAYPNTAKRNALLINEHLAKDGCVRRSNPAERLAKTSRFSNTCRDCQRRRRDDPVSPMVS